MKLLASFLSIATVASASVMSLLSQAPIRDGILSPPEHVTGPCRGYDSPQVVCLRRYASILNEGFERTPHPVIGDGDTYTDTKAPGDPSFRNIDNADFLILDSRRAHELLGDNPQNDFVFTAGFHSHNAVVYIPETEELMYSCLQNQYLPQTYIKVTADPPTRVRKTADPPVYAPAGARYRDGLVYVSTIGGDANIDGHSYRPGVYTIDPLTMKSKTILNNYFGWFFSSVDDLDIDSDNNIWFTDNYYGRPCHVNDQAPQINRGTYRFNMDTGLATVVEDSLIEPNGIQFSADGKRLYMTDTAAGVSIIDPNIKKVPGIQYNLTGARTVYSYDVETVTDNWGDKTKRLINKAPLHYSLDYAPDGLKISREGYLVTAAGKGITVLTQTGVPVMRVQTNITLTNLAWAGKDMEELWGVGLGGIVRIRMGIKGPLPSSRIRKEVFWY